MEEPLPPDNEQSGDSPFNDMYQVNIQKSLNGNKYDVALDRDNFSYLLTFAFDADIYLGKNCDF